MLYPTMTDSINNTSYVDEYTIGYDSFADMERDFAPFIDLFYKFNDIPNKTRLYPYKPKQPVHVGDVPVLL